MNQCTRRQMVGLGFGGLASLRIWEGVAAADATPIAQDVVPSWRHAVDDLAAHGSRIVQAFVDGDTETVRTALTPEVRSQMGTDGVQRAYDAMTSNLVRFRLDATQFVGHVTDKAIRGMTFDHAPGGFQLTPASPQSSDVPSGKWSGMVTSPSFTGDLSVTFSGSRDALAATIDVPAKKVAAAEARDVRFVATTSIGKVEDTRVLPLGLLTSNHTYAELRRWDDLLLNISVAFRDGWQVNAFGLTMMQYLEAAVPAGDTRLHLPVRGPWVVMWSGASGFRNPYLGLRASTAYASDLVRWQGGATFTNDGALNEDYLAWGQDVLAPCSGTVTHVLGLGEDLPPSAGRKPGDITLPKNPEGNYLIIKPDDVRDEYVLLGNLLHGSISVRRGQRVETGDVLAKVGNSSSSREPHLHVRLLSSDVLDEAVGIPALFTGFSANGRSRSDRSLEQGTIVESEAKQ